MPAELSIIRPRRAVEVLHDRGPASLGYRWTGGTGYLIGGRLVLTAAHAIDYRQSLEDGQQLLVRTVDGREFGASLLLVCDQSTQVDLALLEISDLLFTENLPAITFAQVNRDSPASVPACWAVGFPGFAEASPVLPGGSPRDTWAVRGEVLPGSKLRAGLLSLQVSSTPRSLPNSMEESEWAGMSGAVVFATDSEGRDYALGVISVHHRPEGKSALTIVPITALIDLPTAAQWWRRLVIADPAELVSLPRAAAAAPAIHSAYLEQVLQIAPERLLDRDNELADLSMFCSGQGPQEYMWLQAPAWAGKSALLSWLVLHPPQGVHIVSFFITARFSGQDDRVAFADVIMDQLAELLDRPIPVNMPEALREARLLQMLSNAAAASREHGQRLILVVDGLDEDRSVVSGADAYSIAALLPTRPPSGLRIITASRPHPPLPSDVPDDHPLRDPGVVRVLGRSSWAEVVRVDMQRELKRLMYGTPSEQSILGLIVAAGGGLSGPDLAELSSLEVDEVEETLHTVVGRTFISHTSNYQPSTAPPVYILGHEELQISAQQFLGERRLSVYRQKLHTWAERYRQLGWPPDTPEYLLRGYYRMLYATGDISAIFANATDRARHDRMFDVTGGDNAGLAEIMEAQDAILELDEPDLLAMTQLAMHRTSISERNAGIPISLPAVWAALGNSNRALALAHAISHRERRVRALIAVANAVAIGQGDLDHARAIAQQAQEMVADIADPGVQAQVLALLVETLALAGDLSSPETLIHGLTDSYVKEKALTNLVKILASTGHLVRASTLSRTITRSYFRAEASCAIIETMAREGNLAEAETLLRGMTTSSHAHARALTALVRHRASSNAKSAAAMAREIPDPYFRAGGLAAVAEAVLRAGDLHEGRLLVQRAEAEARRVVDPDSRARALAAVAEAVVRAGDLHEGRLLAQRAEAEARRVVDPDSRARALAAVAEAVVRAGDLHEGRLLAQRAEAEAQMIVDADSQARALIAVAKATIEVGDMARAERFARAVADPGQRALALITVIRAVSRPGDLDAAEALARSMPDSEWRSTALTALVRAMVRVRDLERAEMMIREITAPDSRSRAIIALVKAMASAGNLKKAEELVGEISDSDFRAAALTTLIAASAKTGDPRWTKKLAERSLEITLRNKDVYARARGMADLVEAVVKAGLTEWASSLAQQANDFTFNIKDHHIQKALLPSLIRSLGLAGDLDRAEELARQMTDRRFRSHAFSAVVTAATVVGDFERAENIASEITDRKVRPEAWTSLIMAVAASGSLNHAKKLASDLEPETRAKALIALAGIVDHKTARSLVARALMTSDWILPLDIIAKIQPSIIAVIVDDYFEASVR
jgi:hypothetical protein